MMKLIDDFDKYSDLILSVKTHEKDRPLEPIEVAKYIQRMIRELPSENLVQISKRLHLNDDSQTKSFLKLLDLPEKIHYLLGWKVHQEEKIPFTVGVVLSDLEKKDDIEYVIKSGLEHKFTKEEARRVVQFRKKFPNKPIAECIEEVLKVRPVVEKGYIIINVLKQAILERIQDITKKNNSSEEKLVLDLVNKRLINGKTESVKIVGRVVRLTMDEHGYKALLNLQEKMKVRFNDIISKIIEEEFDND